MALLLFIGCVPKYQPVRLAEPMTAAVVVVLDSEEERVVLAAPEYLRAAVAEELAARNLAVTQVPVADVVEGFQRLRGTPHRLAHLAEKAPDAELLVLVETRGRFESRLEGARRWTVSARITVARADARDLPSQADLETPVFLRFEFEQAGEALRDATSVIVKRLGRVVDELLEGFEGVSGASRGPRISEDAGLAQSLKAAAGDVVYFVMVDRFADGLPNGKGTVDPGDPQAFHGGDLPGLISRLDHLEELGIGAIWLSPVFAMRDEKVGEHGAFHGYWTFDPYSVEPRFGTEADLRRLSDELHRRGMKLYLDFVANHVGYEAPLLTQKPEWFHGLGNVVNWDDPVEATTHDVHGLPDLAHENREVRDWLIAAGRHWIEAVQPDGFRLDAVRHVPLDFWAEFNDAMREAGGDDFVLLGEMFDGNPGTLARIAERGGFSHLFDFPLHYAIIDTVCGDAPLGRLAAALTSDWPARGGVTPVTFVDNHDLPRLLSACGGDVERAGVALEVLLASRGVPCITFGTEAGLDGPGEPENRADMRFERHRLGDILKRAIARREEYPGLADGGTRVLELTSRSLIVSRGGTVLILRQTKAGVELDLRPEPEPAAPVGQTAMEWRVQSDLPDVEAIFAVGAGSRLGDWDPSRALGPFQRTKDGFRFVADFPEGVVLEYKLVARRTDGSYEWEDRADRYLLVERGAAPDLTWGA
jgi:hypothetical protein